MSGGGDLAPPVFIVGTGRCGSTMLSDMVNLHPRMLSVSEFFASLADTAFRGRMLDGKALYRRLSTLRPVGRTLLKNDLMVGEYLYPLEPDSRFGPDDVPPIMGATLPHLTDDPEGLWDELVPVVRGRRTDALAAQYRFGRGGRRRHERARRDDSMTRIVIAARTSRLSCLKAAADLRNASAVHAEVPGGRDARRRTNVDEALFRAELAFDIVLEPQRGAADGVEIVVRRLDDRGPLHGVQH